MAFHLPERHCVDATDFAVAGITHSRHPVDLGKERCFMSSNFSCQWYSNNQLSYFKCLDNVLYAAFEIIVFRHTVSESWVQLTFKLE